MPTKPRRIKKAAPAMAPVKKWLSRDEACSFLDMSINFFESWAREKRLTVSVAGKTKKYYRVTELEQALESSILFKAS